MRHKIETERADLFDVNMTIAMAVRLNVMPELRELKDAFDAACRLHEVLNTRVVIEPSGEAFYVEADGPHSSFNETALTFTELISANESVRFRLEDGEFIRGFLSPDGLVFLMHHLGGDGKSLLYFIETFLRCLAGEACEFTPFRSLTLDNLPAESRLPFFFDLLEKGWNKKWQKNRPVFTFSDLDAAYDSFWAAHRTETSIRHYNSAELEQLLGKARETGVTLTAYLITDMIKDMGRKADVGLAVDGRLDKTHAMGNQATGISVEYEYNKALSFRDNALKVQGLMKKKLDDTASRYLVLQFMGQLDPTLTDALNLEHAGYYSSKLSARVAELMGYGSKVKDISITNLTRADIPYEYGEYRIEDIIFVPPVVSYGKTIIGIVTAGGSMNIATHVYSEGQST